MLGVSCLDHKNMKTAACTRETEDVRDIFLSHMDEPHSEEPRCEVHVRLTVGSLLGRPGSRISAPAVYFNQIHQIIAPLHPSLSMHGRLSSCGLLPPGMGSKADSAIFA